MVEIPFEQLSPEALYSVLEEFATRDGTELTDRAVKVSQLETQLRTGLLKIFFDPDSETCQVVTT